MRKKYILRWLNFEDSPLNKDLVFSGTKHSSSSFSLIRSAASTAVSSALDRRRKWRNSDSGSSFSDRWKALRTRAPWFRSTNREATSSTRKSACSWAASSSEESGTEKKSNTNFKFSRRNKSWINLQRLPKMKKQHKC